MLNYKFLSTCSLFYCFYLYGVASVNGIYCIKFEYSNGGNVVRYTETKTRITQKLCSLLVYFTNTVSMLMFQCISI